MIAESRINRRTILQALVTSAALDANKLAKGDDQKKEAILVSAGEDRGKAAVTIANCKLSGRDTNGALSIFGGDPNHRPGGVPLHVHRDQDEWWFVVDGEHVFQIGDRKIHAKIGDAVFGPRGVPHSPRQLSERGSVITAFQPAGTMEEFFHELAQALRSGALSPPQTAALFKSHGMEIVGAMVEP